MSIWIEIDGIEWFSLPNLQLKPTCAIFITFYFYLVSPSDQQSAQHNNEGLQEKIASRLYQIDLLQQINPFSERKRALSIKTSVGWLFNLPLNQKVFIGS